MKTVFDLIGKFVCLIILSLIVGGVAGYFVAISLHVAGLTWSLSIVVRVTIIIVFVLFCIGHIVFRKK